MEKNISLTAKQNIVMNVMMVTSHLMTKAMSVVNMPISMLAKYYSDCLGREISIRQTWMLLNAQAAFFMAAFPVSCPFVARVVCICWLLHALRQCRNNL